MPNFTTGFANLPDVGVASYNGCVFSPYFYSSISATPAPDEANRTIKYTELTITIDGYVTMGQANALAIQAADIAPTMATLHRLLTAQGGALRYEGRGFDLVVNPAAGVGGPNVLVAGGLPAGGALPNNAIAGRVVTKDVAWGPVPKLIDFQPMGAGLSAKVKWQVVVRVSPIVAGKGFIGARGASSPLTQFNFETVVSYGEDGFSRLSVRGTLEIPMTRQANQQDRSVPITADDFRGVVERRILRNIDLSRFRLTNREFNTSRDKRTLTFDVTAEEKPFMDLPPFCTIARGSYQVKPAKAGPGLAMWHCTLNITYTLRADAPRRISYESFLLLMSLRMAESENGNIPDLSGGEQNPFPRPPPITAFNPLIGTAITAADTEKYIKRQEEIQKSRKAILMDFSINEGIYLDSKTVGFSATWKICTTLSHILLASGLWTKLNEHNPDGSNCWATTMRDIEGGDKSWLANALRPGIDVIVDFGSSE